MEHMPSPPGSEHRPGSGPSESEVKQRLIGVIVGLALFNLLWFLLQLLDGSDGRRGDTRWPSQLDAWSATRNLLTDGFLGETLFSSTAATLVRVFASIGLATVLGGGLGIVMGLREKLRNLLDPFVTFMRFMTPVIVVSMSTLFLGIGDRNIIISAGFVTTWFVADGVARTVASGGSAQQMTEMFVQVARTALLLTWLVVAFTEVIGAAAGLGVLIWSARTFDRTGLMLAMSIWSALLFATIDYAIRLLGRTLRR